MQPSQALEAPSHPEILYLPPHPAPLDLSIPPNNHRLRRENHPLPSLRLQPLRRNLQRQPRHPPPLRRQRPRPLPDPNLRPSRHTLHRALLRQHPIPHSILLKTRCTLTKLRLPQRPLDQRPHRRRLRSHTRGLQNDNSDRGRRGKLSRCNRSLLRPAKGDQTRRLNTGWSAVHGAHSPLPTGLRYHAISKYE